MNKEEFIKKLLSEKNESSSVVHFVQHDSEFITFSIIDLLQLDKSRFTPEALMAIDVLETDKTFGCHTEYQRFKWMISAYLNLQDAFPSILYSDTDEQILFSRYYFYYEALSILREYIYSGFNNMTISARQLIRTFIEFNLRQLYFFERCKREESFSSIRKYLKDGIVPSNHTIINYILPSNSFCKPIKKYIQMMIRGLSESSSHAFDPWHSVRTDGKLRHEYSLDSLLFWLTMFSSFNSVLWPYYVMFPTLLKPRDVIRKFGFNYIPGLFIADFQHVSIKKTFTGNELELFMLSDPMKAELQNLDEIYSSFKDLSDKEIVETWKEENELKGFLEGYMMQVAHMRAISELISHKSVNNSVSEFDLNFKTDLDQLSMYRFWKDNYKKFGSN